MFKIICDNINVFTPTNALTWADSRDCSETNLDKCEKIFQELVNFRLNEIHAFHFLRIK